MIKLYSLSLKQFTKWMYKYNKLETKYKKKNKQIIFFFKNNIENIYFIFLVVFQFINEKSFFCTIRKK